jgi:hypothetical protein
MSSNKPNPSLAEGRVSRTDRAEEPARRERAEKPEAEDREFTHMLTVLSVSSGMVGVCLTAIGLIGIMRRLSPMEVMVDDVLVISTLLFMAAAILSFLGLRAGPIRKWRHFARTLDLIFCIGLFLVVVATVLLTWVVL